MGLGIPPRLQGDIGEFSALGWLLRRGASVFLPHGHSPDVDMVAERHFSSDRCDFLFVHVADGRR